jgi:hypothetical protein
MIDALIPRRPGFDPGLSFFCLSGVGKGSGMPDQVRHDGGNGRWNWVMAE